MRSGVRFRPSRSGSSPRFSRTSRYAFSRAAWVFSISGVKALGIDITRFVAAPFTRSPFILARSALLPSQFTSSCVLEGIQHGLFDSNFLHGCKLELTTKEMKQLARKILGCGHYVAKRVQLIKIAELKARHHDSLHKAVEIGEVADHSGCRIGLATYRDFDFVVMSMAIGIIAFAVNLLISFRAELRRMEAVRRRELIASC